MTDSGRIILRCEAAKPVSLATRAGSHLRMTDSGRVILRCEAAKPVSLEGCEIYFEFSVRAMKSGSSCVSRSIRKNSQ